MALTGEPSSRDTCKTWNLKIKQEPESSGADSDIQEEEYVTSDLYYSSCVPYTDIKIKKEERRSPSPESSTTASLPDQEQGRSVEKDNDALCSQEQVLIGKADRSHRWEESKGAHNVPLQVCLETAETSTADQLRDFSRSLQERRNGTGGKPRGRRSPLQCPLCPYSSNNATTMREHLPVHTGERPHRCPTCGKRFARKKYFRVHLRLHDKNGDNDASGEEHPHTCPTCGETFARQQFLQRHLETAHLTGNGDGTSGNVCPQCHKRYKYVGNLRTHMRTHTGERPYMCDVCGLRFTCSSYLQVHLRTHVRDKPYVCPECGKSFVHNSALTVHLRSHTGEQPYQCPHCPLRFSHLRNMKRHEICIHTRQYPHNCPHCARGFLVVTHWRQHMATHHSDDTPPLEMAASA